MTGTWKSRLLALALCAAPVVATAQEAVPISETPDSTAPETPDSTAQAAAASPMKLALWTDKLGYATDEDVTAYATIDPMGDAASYVLYLYRENIETGERLYLTPLAAGPSEGEGAVAADGSAPDAATAAPVSIAISKLAIHSAPAPEAGLWHYVGEVRTADSTQVVKRAYAKFVVSSVPAVEFGADGQDTEISVDTTWNNDTIYRVRHQVFVNAGATLEIEPGTLILAKGQNAVIVVERGGKIMADGRREAPIVMTCDQPVGLRDSGCWAGLIVLGDAPMTRGTGRAEGVIPETRPVYGGMNTEDSSGVLRYVRVEFAGVDFNPETQPNAFGFHGIGSGTVIDHIQAHEAEDDGIEFFGGNANCMYCVSSGSKDDSLDWTFGWQGNAQYLYIQQDPLADNGIEADNDSSGFDSTPRSHPVIYNATMVGGLAQDPTSTSGDGMRIRVGTAITARNVLLTGFGGEALDVRDNSPDLFIAGTSSIQNSIITGNGGYEGTAQIIGGIESVVGFQDVAPMLVNVRYEANPDPRPMPGSPALLVGAAAVPPSNGDFDTSAQCVGAFCNGENWLEEWTFFGDEADYDTEFE